MTPVITSDSTYGAKTSSRSDRAPAQPPVEQQRQADGQRQLDQQDSAAIVRLCCDGVSEDRVRRSARL